LESTTKQLYTPAICHLKPPRASTEKKCTLVQVKVLIFDPTLAQIYTFTCRQYRSTGPWIDNCEL